MKTPATTPDITAKPTKLIQIVTRNRGSVQSPFSLTSIPNNHNNVSKSPNVSETVATTTLTSLPRSLSRSDSNEMEVANLDENIEEEGFHDCDNGFSSEEEKSAARCGVPRYCRMTACASTVNIDMTNVVEDMEEDGDGGDSGVEGQLCEELDLAVAEADLENRTHNYENEIAQFTDRNVTILADDEKAQLKLDSNLNKYAPSPPDGWIPNLPKIQSNEPLLFSYVDNPGDWTPYAFRPEFESKGGKYKGHFLLPGARPLEADEIGDRKAGACTFHYQGWEKILISSVPVQHTKNYPQSVENDVLTRKY